MRIVDGRWDGDKTRSKNKNCIAISRERVTNVFHDGMCPAVVFVGLFFWW